MNVAGVRSAAAPQRRKRAFHLRQVQQQIYRHDRSKMPQMLRDAGEKRAVPRRRDKVDVRSSLIRQMSENRVSPADESSA